MKPSIQQLLNSHFDNYRSQVGVSFDQARAIRSIKVCRTQSLGAHISTCDAGHVLGVWYNSCKHRACPQCSSLPQAQWLAHIRSFILDCAHHHVIFTLPSEFNLIWAFNRATFTDVFFKAVHQTLTSFSVDAKYLAAKPGIMSCLHTWGRDLSLHPHIHCLVSHGGMNEAGEWVIPKKTCLFPQKPMMFVFRGKILAALRHLNQQGQLQLPSSITKQQFFNLLNQLGRKEWVVHCCKRYDHAEGVAKYLARYIRGGPLKNSQLIRITQNEVVFRYQSHKTHRLEVGRFSIQTFIQRWLQHIPVRGKMLLRYSGIYSSGARKLLASARQACHQQPIVQNKLLTWQSFLQTRHVSLSCPFCQAKTDIQQQDETSKIFH